MPPIINKTLVGLTALLISYSSIASSNKLTPQQQLYAAKEIHVKEHSMSMGKDYDIEVNGKKVATISGKDMRFMGGDIFTLKTTDGNVLAYEKEQKRFLRMNRVAACYNPQNQVTGYIGEKHYKDFFSFSYVFHFYDSNKKEVGKSQKLGKSSWNHHTLKDNQGNVDYTIDKKTVLFGGDHYILKVKDKKSTIPLTSALLLTCIEDAIGDAND